MDDLVFQSSPTVNFASNIFIDVPVILQYDDTPLISVIRELSVGHLPGLDIFSSSGDRLAKVKGSRLFLTKDGEKADLKLKKPDRLTTCTLGDTTLFELRRDGPAALSIQAELYTPTGVFIQCAAGFRNALHPTQNCLQIGGMLMQGNTKIGGAIGIHLRSDGSLSF
ncbi:MAG: hypothetical protein H7Y88_02885 [Phycisphaerales bacterium]|nr:hypothetical protein [Phycisphaerales bacterium]